LRAESRGYRYELTPPIPVDVVPVGRFARRPHQQIRCVASRPSRNHRRRRRRQPHRR